MILLPKIINRAFLTLVVVASISLCFTNKTHALEWDYIKDRQALAIDESISDQSETKYKEPKRIIITQVTTKSESLSLNSKAWVQTLYYYSITRLGFADIPYNYLFDRDGNVYQGRGGYVGAVPELQELEGVILVGYLSNGTDFTTSSQSTLVKLVSDLSKAYGISKQNVFAVNLDIIKGSGYNTSNSNLVVLSDEELAQQANLPNLSKITYVPVTDSAFAKSTSTALDKATYYAERQYDITASITDVTKSVEKVNASGKYDVSLTVENRNSFPWFLTNKYIYVSTQDGKSSEYAVNGEWDSFTKPAHIGDQVVLPGQKVDLSFPMLAPDYPTAEAKEDFKLVIDPGIDVKDSAFSVSILVERGDGTFVEIQPTQAGVLNVRSCNYIECEIITQVPVGQVYRVLEENNGWYKIKIGDGSGWVGGMYAKKVE
jgi:hypothetical protein